VDRGQVKLVSFLYTTNTLVTSNTILGHVSALQSHWEHGPPQMNNFPLSFRTGNLVVSLFYWVILIVVWFLILITIIVWLISSLHVLHFMKVKGA